MKNIKKKLAPAVKPQRPEQKVHRGHIPPRAKGWKRIAEIGEEWNLYARRTTDSEWVSLKLVAKPGFAPEGRANYWFGYSLDEERFANSADYWKCKRSRRSLLNAILGAICDEYYGGDPWNM